MRVCAFVYVCCRELCLCEWEGEAWAFITQLSEAKDVKLEAQGVNFILRKCSNQPSLWQRVLLRSFSCNKFKLSPVFQVFSLTYFCVFLGQMHNSPHWGLHGRISRITRWTLDVNVSLHFCWWRWLMCKNAPLDLYCQFFCTCRRKFHFSLSLWRVAYMQCKNRSI